MSKTDETFDAWETDESSGLLSSYEGTIAEAYFFTDPKYNNGQSLMIGFEIDKDTVEMVDPDAVVQLPDDALIERYGVGAGWTTEDGGATAEHPSKRIFTASSQYGRIIDAIQGKLDGLGENAECTTGFDLADMNFDGLIDVLRARGNPQSAEIWNGLRFRWEEVVIDYGTDKEGRPMQSRRNFPVEFIGQDGDESAKKPAATPAKKAAKKSAKKAAKKATAATEPDDAGEDADDTSDDSDDGKLSEATFTAMVAIAAECETFEDYVDAALADADIAADPAALDDLADEDTSTTWAKACEDAEG